MFPTVIKFALGWEVISAAGQLPVELGEHFKGRWSAPAMFVLEGANIGFQIGGLATDYVLLVMNPQAAN